MKCKDIIFLLLLLGIKNKNYSQRYCAKNYANFLNHTTLSDNVLRV